VSGLSLALGPEDPPFACDDCGGATRVARGGVREGGRDRAIYLVSSTEGHRPIALALSLGRFGAGTTPADRVVVTMLARLAEDGGFELMVVDPERSPVDCDAILGRQLDRAEALTRPEIGEVFRIAEHVVNADPRANAWLAATAVH
jgi:hypothetical protein